MIIPDSFDLSAIKEMKLSAQFNEIMNEIDTDGYFMIDSIHKFKDVDIAFICIRGSDPLLSKVKKCRADTRLLKYIMELIDGHVSYNYTIKDGRLCLPDTVSFENFSFTAPRGENTVYSSVGAVPATPVEIIWRLACGKYSFIFDGCAPVPCSNVYFGQENFSIMMKYTDTSGNTVEVTLIRFDNGLYTYTPFNIIYTGVGALRATDYIVDSFPECTVKDDLGRERKARTIDLSRYERNMLNVTRFNKLFDKCYTLTVFSRMYNLTAYLDGIGLVLSGLDYPCQTMSLPYRNKSAFSVASDKQHNNFSFQIREYNPSIIKDVVSIYSKYKSDMIKYLKTKDDDLRDELYDRFCNECDGKYGKLFHYYVNGVFDALAIQKGDKQTRTKILSGYYNTVHKEFVMYCMYYYDMRTAFLRNNFRIGKEFNNRFVLNEYDGQYFLVG